MYDLLVFLPQAMKLDVEYKEDKISSLGREVADLENRGADQEEVRYSIFILNTKCKISNIHNMILALRP